MYVCVGVYVCLHVCVCVCVYVCMCVYVCVSACVLCVLGGGMGYPSQIVPPTTSHLPQPSPLPPSSLPLRLAPALLSLRAHWQGHLPPSSLRLQRSLRQHTPALWCGRLHCEAVGPLLWNPGPHLLSPWGGDPRHCLLPTWN